MEEKSNEQNKKVQLEKEFRFRDEDWIAKKTSPYGTMSDDFDGEDLGVNNQEIKELESLIREGFGFFQRESKVYYLMRRKMGYKNESVLKYIKPLSESNV